MPWALVTGGGRRLGRAFVEACADAGFAVAVHVHRSLEAGEEAVALVRQKGLPAELVVADLGSARAATTMLEELARSGRAPALLVNNAARFDHDRLESVAPEVFDRQVAVNLKAPLLTSQAFARHLPAGVQGLIVNLVDQRITRPDANYLSYGLSKAALWALTQNLALALAPRIRVNAIAPGLALADVGMDEATQARIVGRFPLGTGGPVDDVVSALRYLIATPSVTGQLLLVDGGAHLGRRARPQDVG
ncbi:MAG: SDR family oxidoreductase [Geminicoccaceae bacterium]|nr:MAG: SDR family oxidoreductase [Geminicoccaceae bacterium]